MTPTPKRLTLMSLAAAAALAAGCGSSDDPATPAAAPASTAAPAAAAPTMATGGKLALTAKDFSFSAETVEADAGKLEIDLDNMGSSPHELVLLKSTADPASLKVSGGRVAEDASVGEIGEIDGGAKGSHTFDLKPGKYVFVCNIPGHYADGMRGELTVK